MKRLISATFAMLLVCGFVTAQSSQNDKVIVRTSNSFKISPPLGSLTPAPVKKQTKRKEVKNRFGGFDYPNAATALPNGADPALQTTRGVGRSAVSDCKLGWDNLYDKP